MFPSSGEGVGFLTKSYVSWVILSIIRHHQNPLEFFYKIRLNIITQSPSLSSQQTFPKGSNTKNSNMIFVILTHAHALSIEVSRFLCPVALVNVRKVQITKVT
jgi:hypothetical protein